jgi:HEAT repeat protein
MKTVCDHQSKIAAKRALCAALFCAILTNLAVAQVGEARSGKSANESQKKDLADALARLRQGSPLLADFNRIASAGAVEAVPELEKQFDETQDEDRKGCIASALVRLRDKDGPYWDYLVKGASLAIDTEVPPQEQFDSQGALVPGPSPEFIAWAEAHNQSVDGALRARYRLSLKVLLLGKTGDPRAIPLLRRALSAHDFMTQAFAAEGLAEMQDQSSIPLIIRACERAPIDAAFNISQHSLLNYNDAAAKAAAERFAAAHAAAARSN